MSRWALAFPALLFALVLPHAAAFAQDGALGGFGASDEPVRIDSKQLEVIDREQKAIYSGDVVVTQGKSVLRCSKLTVFYTQRRAGEANPDAPPESGNGLRRLECAGPLSAISGTSTITGDKGTFEGASQIITVTGNVIMTDCQNVQRGDKLVYNMKSGIATVTGGRVSGIFAQNGGSQDGGKASKGCD